MNDIQMISVDNVYTASNLCRVCLKESRDMKYLHEKLYSEDIDTISVFDCLTTLAHGHITENPKYPPFICHICADLLKIFYNLRLQFCNSQKILANYYGDRDSDTQKYSNHGMKILNRNSYPVELISEHGIFDLNDIVVVENQEEKLPNYDGFLKNLGTEISATFVIKSLSCEKGKLPSNKETNEINLLVKRPVYKKVFKNSIHLKTLKTFAHKNQCNSFICELCGLFLKTRLQLRRHKIMHSGKRHVCTICKKSFTNLDHLSLHTKAIHLNNARHLCSVCGKRFNYFNSLKYHMRLHADEQKYSCSYCNKKFTMQSGLKRHLLTHTGVRNHKCNFCDKTASSKSDIKFHERTHTGFKPYKCEHCHKKVSKRHNLKIHLMSHEGTHTCYFCEKSFIEIDFLKLHIKKVHSC